MSTVYPTYEAVKAERKNTSGSLTSIDFHRLRWFIKKDISLNDSITVIQDVTDPESAQEPYSASHSISKVALTCPLVSAITISVDTLNEYHHNWGYEHEKYAVPDSGELTISQW